MSTQEKIISLVSEATKVDAATLKETTNFTDDLNLDSLDMVELMMKMEDEFDIEIPENDAEGFKTVGDVLEYLKNKNVQ